MNGKIGALTYMLGEARGLGSKFRLLRGLVLAELFPGTYKSRPRTMDVAFLPFVLRFRVGQGELTPYREIREIIGDILPRDPAELRTWNIIDCGANIGMFSLFCKEAAKIIAIEPNEDCWKRLDHNFRTNGIRGEAVRCAVSAAEGEVRMNISADSTVLSAVSNDGNCVVPALPIDTLVSRYNLPRVDLLKLDVEDYEMEALAGAKRSLERGLVRRIFTEFHGQDRLREIDSFLAPYGLNRTTTYSYNAFYVLTTETGSGSPAVSATATA